MLNVKLTHEQQAI